MARCKWCEKGGLFKKVNRDGLCATCEPAVAPDIEEHSEVIYQGMHVYERAQTREEKLTALDEILRAAEHLKRYEARGLETCNPPPTPVAVEYGGFREQLLAEGG